MTQKSLDSRTTLDTVPLWARRLGSALTMGQSRFHRLPPWRRAEYERAAAALYDMPGAFEALMASRRCAPAPIGCGQPIRVAYYLTEAEHEYRQSGLCNHCQAAEFGLNAPTPEAESAA